MLDDAEISIRSHLPAGPYLLFVLIAGVMAGLLAWSLISSPRTRAAAEDRDTRGQLQTELRSLVGAPVMPPASAAGTSSGAPLAKTAARPSLKWLGFVALIALAFTLWATINYYVSSTQEIDDEAEPISAEPSTTAPPPIPEWMNVAVRSSRDGIMSVDSSGRILMANPAAEKMMGFEPGRLPGQKVFALVPDLGQGPDDLRRFAQVASATTVGANRRDGVTEPILLSLQKLQQKSDTQYVATFFPAPSPAPPVVAVTTPKEVAPPVLPPRVSPAEPETRAVSPAASLINENALRDLENQVVMLGGYSELVVAALDVGHPARPDAEAVSRSAARANLLCHEVAPFTTAHPRWLDLNEFVIAAAAPLARVLDDGCAVKGFRSQGAAEVWADPDLLERSICSLAWRTQDLAGGLKRVSISVANGRLDLRMVPMGRTGAATPAAFDALMAIDWIEKQSGTIEMEEHSETGVRFRIWLPAAAQARQPRSQTQSDPASQSHAAD